MGADFSLTTPSGLFSPSGISILQTHDGANILFQDQGYQNGQYVYGSVTFQTGDKRYNWVNSAVLVSRALVTIGSSSAGVGLEIFQVISQLVDALKSSSLVADTETGGLGPCLWTNQARVKHRVASFLANCSGEVNRSCMIRELCQRV